MMAEELTKWRCNSCNMVKDQQLMISTSSCCSCWGDLNEKKQTRKLAAEQKSKKLREKDSEV